MGTDAPGSDHEPERPSGYLADASFTGCARVGSSVRCCPENPPRPTFGIGVVVGSGSRRSSPIPALPEDPVTRAYPASAIAYTRSAVP